MRIAVIGAGAMGSFFGGHLSLHNEVLLVDVNKKQVDTINERGLMIYEPDGSHIFCRPSAAVNTKNMIPADLVILLVKSMFTRSALYSNGSLIGENTYLLSLQNGGGHEDTLLDFVDRDHVLLGTTQHACSMLGYGEVRHTGKGRTYIGSLNGVTPQVEEIVRTLSNVGLETYAAQNIWKMVWDKLLVNASASVLTGILQVPLGFIAKNSDAWAMCCTLIREAAAVALTEGLEFDVSRKMDEVRAVCEANPDGLTSIYMDIHEGMRTEVDAISGSVVRASRRNGVPAPTHEAMVDIVHALEARQAQNLG